MKKNDLAILGGEKTIHKQFKKYNSIGVKEKKIVEKVINSGILSKFLASWGPDFYGGKYVQKFEKDCRNFFKVKHAITVNSWTSGIIAAIGALDIEPGDEIIVTPWTMCATSTAILHWNAIPVFVDIEPSTFNINPKKIEEKITKKTKAIIAVDIFGHPCDFHRINKIAKKYSLKVITDSAQSPGSLYKNKLTGTESHIGGFSLNYHKHIHTGEGGIIVTNDDNYAERLFLLRNHAETIVEGKGVKKINNMVGYNFRLGEIESAIGIEQLKKLDFLVRKRQKIANYLFDGLKDLNGLKLPKIEKNCTHSFYIFPMVLDLKKIKISRKKILKALEAEGVVGLTEGYVLTHLLPMFQKKIAYGSKGFPWKIGNKINKIDYSRGICPVAEDLHFKSFIGFEMCLFDLTIKDCDLISKSFKKVWNNLEKLN